MSFYSMCLCEQGSLKKISPDFSLQPHKYPSIELYSKKSEMSASFKAAYPPTSLSSEEVYNGLK